MPHPDFGLYTIRNESSEAWLGVADDNRTVVCDATPAKAQVWEVRPDTSSSSILYLTTVLKNGEIVYLSVRGGSVIVDASMDKGSYHTWLFDWMGENWRGEKTWRICAGPSPTYLLSSGRFGIGSQTIQVLVQSFLAVGPTEHWSFHPWDQEQIGVFGPPNSYRGFFFVSSQTLQMITKDMLFTFRDNLKEIHPSSRSAICNHVTRIPDGTETGSFLALTIADKLTVSYFEHSGMLTHMRNFILKSAQLDGSTDLFKYIAKCIANAVQNWHVNGTSEEPLHMEISISISGTAGEDVVKLLQDALDGEGLYIKCNALVNDATVILLAQAYEYGKCEIGAIFDNETNGAYVDETINLQTFQGREGQIILNTDWGSFESKTLPRTQFDYHVDRESAHPGEQVFQKLVSASCVGELTRLVLLHYIDCGLPTEHRPRFNRQSSQKLNAKGAIDIDLMWEIDTAKDGIAVQRILVTKLDLPQDEVSEEDGRLVKEVCRMVLLRAARLSACPLAALFVLMGRASLSGSGFEPGGQIGIAGSLTHPAFQRDMHEALGQLIGASTAKNVFIRRRGLRDVNDLGAAVRASVLPEKDEMVGLPGLDQPNI